MAESRSHPPLRLPVIALRLMLLICAALAVGPGMARAADRARIEAFLTVTGFDVALDSIRLSAGSAPRMIGIDPGAFGADWERVTDEVFDTRVMHGLALDILAGTLSDELLTHAADFYASDLGQRLVAAENASHMMADDAAKQAEGMKIVAALVEQGSDRLELLKRMNLAIDAAGTGARALLQIQLRFMLAASAAGVIDLRMDFDELQAALAGQEGQLRLALQRSGLAASAYTYRSFPDADIAAYVEALEDPRMQQVYELMNAVQYELMANRFEFWRSGWPGCTRARTSDMGRAA